MCVCDSAEQSRADSRERNPQNPRNPTKDQEMGKHPNPKPQTTRIQDPTKLLVGEGERGKQRSQDPQMGTSLACRLQSAKCKPRTRTQPRTKDGSPLLVKKKLKNKSISTYGMIWDPGGDGIFVFRSRFLSLCCVFSLFALALLGPRRRPFSSSAPRRYFALPFFSSRLRIPSPLAPHAQFFGPHLPSSASAYFASERG